MDHQAAMRGVVDRLVTAREAAEVMGLQISTIRRLTYERRLPVVRPTGRRAVRYRMSDLQALLQARMQPAQVL